MKITPNKRVTDCPEAEMSLIAALLMNAAMVFDTVAEQEMELRADWFSVRPLRTIFYAVTELEARMPGAVSEHNGPVAVAQHLREKGLFLEGTVDCKGDKVADEYLAEIASLGAVAMTANLVVYIKIAHAAWNTRVMHVALEKAAGIISPASEHFDANEPISEKILRLQGVILSACDFVEGNKVGAVKHVSDVVGDLVKQVETCISNQAFDDWSGLDTGIPELNDALSGLRPGEVGIIAARPGCGKTALAIHIALKSAAVLKERREKAGNKKMPLFYFVSAEMMDQQIAMRIAGLATNTNTQFGRDGGKHLHKKVAHAESMVADLSGKMGVNGFDGTSPEGKKTLERFEFWSEEVRRERKILNDKLEELKALPVGRLVDLPILIDDRSDLTIRDIRATALRLLRSGGEFSRGNTEIDGMGLIIVDYIQLIGGDPGKHGLGKNYTRTDEVGSVSKGLKNLAKELGVPIIALSQLNREKEKSAQGRDPQLADIKDSGQIEQDADFVLFLDENRGDDKVRMPEGRKQINMILAKNRHGPTGKWSVGFTPSQNKFHLFVKKAAPTQVEDF